MGASWDKFAWSLVCLVGFALWGENYTANHGFLPAPPTPVDSAWVRRYQEHFEQRMLDYPGEPYRGRMWDNGMRASRPLALAARSKRVLVVGCSFTWGMGVNDEDTFPWKLNEMFANTSFDNGGRVGAGPVSSLETIKERLEQQHYDAVIYAFIEGHLRREIAPFPQRVAWRTHPAPGAPKYHVLFTTAYAPLPLESAEATEVPCHVYSLWGDSRSCLISSFKQMYVQTLSRWYDKPRQEVENSQAPSVHQAAARRFLTYLHKMQTVCQQQGAKFGLVCLERDASEGEGDLPKRPSDVPWLEACFPEDLSSDRRYGTAPSTFDCGAHPTPLVQAYYAQQIARWLKEAPECKEWELE